MQKFYFKVNFHTMFGMVEMEGGERKGEENFAGNLIKIAPQRLFGRVQNHETLTQFVNGKSK